MRTLAEIFCERYHVAPEEFSSEMLKRCFYPQARLLAPVIGRMSREYFAPDRELVRGIGLLQSATGLHDELVDHYGHPRNRGFCRRQLRVRISVRRVSHWVHALLDPPVGGAVGSGGPRAADGMSPAR